MRRLVFFFCLISLIAQSNSRPNEGPQNLDLVGNSAFYNTQSQWADSVFASMTTDQKIGQLFMIPAWSNRGPEHSDNISSLIRNYHIGGLIFMQGGPSRQVRLCNRYQNESQIPLLMAMDAEWGPSMRLDSTVRYSRQLRMGAITDDSVVYRFGAEVARQLKRLGVQMNFAPVIDVNSNPLNPVIGDRSFGENRYNVALKGKAYMDGLQQNGVLACGKHFPGHGDTDTDSHKSLPVINHDYHRLDSVELYPFRVLAGSGLASVMMAHLYIPKLDSTPNLASSLSHRIASDLLRDSLGFRGLVVSDALNMQGVAKYFKPGEVELRAFQAGNDILLFSQDVPKAFAVIKEALKNGQISEEDLDRSVKKILLAKAWAGLDDYKPSSPINLYEDLNSPQAEWVKREVIESGITLVRNHNDVLPFRGADSLDIASLAIGSRNLTAFQDMLASYSDMQRFQVDKSGGAEAYSRVFASLKDRDLVIVSMHDMRRSARSNFGITKLSLEFLNLLSKETRIVLVVFGSPYSLELLPSADGLVVAYDNSVWSQRSAAQALFGGIPMMGRLPVSAGVHAYGDGIMISERIRLKHTIPEEVGIHTETLAKVDSIALDAIRNGATPGCRVMLIKDGKIFHDKAYGYQTYRRKQPVKKTDLYDLASLTKIFASTLNLMKLSEDSVIDINAKLSNYLPELDSTQLGDRLLRDVLTHQAGLTAWIPFYASTLLEPGKPDPKIYASKKHGNYDVHIARDMWMRSDYMDSIWRRIVDAELRKPGNYKYSDLGFYIFYRLINEVEGISSEDLVLENFYEPLGLSHIGYNPLERFPPEMIVPTENDHTFRNQLLRGYVHDMGAAMMGGIEGHAGLFSQAEDLAVISQMLLNGGEYGGKRYLRTETIRRFTSKQNNKCRRGLGFDKPESGDKISPTSHFVSPSTYGHSGFTGTCFWVDPEYDLIYIFLSNRINPDMGNRKLITENVRTKIQDVIYSDLMAPKMQTTPSIGPAAP